MRSLQLAPKRSVFETLVALRKVGSVSLPTWVAAVILTIFSATIALDRALAPAVPINVDPGSYAVVSHELLNGKHLYTDIWDHKPPAPFVTYAVAEILFGYSTSTLYLLNFLATVAVMIAIFAATKQARGDSAAGIFAALLWMLVSGSFGLESRDANTEVLINASVVPAFYLLVSRKSDRMSMFAAVLTGLLFFWASAYKPVVAANIAALLAAYVVFDDDRTQAMKVAFIIGGVGVLSWLALFAYFGATGRFDIFYRSIVDFNAHYSGNVLANIVAPLRGEAEIFIDAIAPLAVFACAGVLLTFLSSKRHGALIAAYAISSWIALAAAGRFSVHYYQLWLPSLIIASAWGIGYLLSSQNRSTRYLSFVAGATLCGMLIAQNIPVYKSVKHNSYVPELPVLNASEQTVAEINGLLRDNESFYLWGNTPNLYLLANRRPPAAILFDNHLRENPLANELAAKVLDQLELSRPEILVVEQQRPSAPEWLTREFEPTPVYFNPRTYAIYARRGGRIAAERLLNSDRRH